MNYLELTQQLLAEAEVTQLSKIIPQILPIALECKDYNGYCVLFQLLSPISQNAETNRIHTDGLIRALLIQGLQNEEIVKIIGDSKKEFVEIKSIDKDQVSSHSVKEIETWLPEAKTTLEQALGISQQHYCDLSARITQVRTLYETIRAYVISKLTYYQQVLKLAQKEEVRYKSQPNIPQKLNTNKVFIVHGHNGEIKEAVARLIENQGIRAIILHEQANNGNTIIEKFEHNSDVGCAVCLFTADDIGRAKNTKNNHSRARQNVVFETGYFIGKLGRDKVILVAERGVEIPSDLHGVVYTNSSDWRFSLLKDLKAIGYNIDFNKLI